MPKDGSRCPGFSIILTNSVFKIDKNYCPQVFQKMEISYERKIDGKIFQ